MNRGIARRAVFEDRACVRYFLSRLAGAVRRGQLEVHAFVFMTTHYHLLVRSPIGELSESLRFLQNMYVRWFNRRFRRDGPLFRGRFLSRPVESMRYRRVLVNYIDQNPVSAGLVESPADYPHGSARCYAARTGPRWLERRWVERDAKERAGVLEYSMGAYQRAFGEALAPHEVELVEARIAHSSMDPDPLDDLVRAAPRDVQRWMTWKAQLADGTRPGLPCASPQYVHDVCGRARAARPEWQLPTDKRRVSAWDVLIVGILRDVAGLRWSEIGARVTLGESAVRRRYVMHRECMVGMAEYRAVAGSVAGECLEST